MFDPRVARRELKRFRRGGPAASTLRLLALMDQAGRPEGATLLDVGGGVGAIHHILLERGFSRATQVDASSAYLAVAQEETTRLGHGDRVTFRHGDFVTVEGELATFDAVTLDRVVCCDPDYERMLGAAAKHAGRFVAFTYPRPRWIVRTVVQCGNRVRALMRRPFRAYVHDPAAMAAVLARHGFARTAAGGTFIWAAEVFDRTGTAPAPRPSKPPTRIA